MINLFITNTPSANKIVNAKGNQVTLNLQTPISLDDNKTYELRVLSCSVVFCFPNVTRQNNVFKYTYNNTPYLHNLDVGLYTLDSLNVAIAILTLQDTGNEDLFYFKADEATSKVRLFFKLVPSGKDLSIDATGSNNVMTMLGFANDNAAVGAGLQNIAADDARFYLSEKVAQLNNVQTILVKCSICQGSSYLDNGLSNVIASITPDAGIWSTVYYRPYHPQHCLVNVKNIYTITVELVDQSNNPIDLSSDGTDTPELWNIAIILSDVKRLDVL